MTRGGGYSQTDRGPPGSQGTQRPRLVQTNLLDQATPYKGWKLYFPTESKIFSYTFRDATFPTFLVFPDEYISDFGRAVFLQSQYFRSIFEYFRVNSKLSTYTTKGVVSGVVGGQRKRPI